MSLTLPFFAVHLIIYGCLSLLLFLYFQSNSAVVPEMARELDEDIARLRQILGRYR